MNAFLKNKLKLAKEFAAHANLDATGAKALLKLHNIIPFRIISLLANQYRIGTVWFFQAEARNSVVDPFKAMNVATFPLQILAPKAP